MSLKLMVPSGIGDISWIFSALYSVRDQISHWGICDGWPYRSKEYVELMHPGVQVTYEKGLQYPVILLFESAHKINFQESPSWEKVRGLGFENILIEANQHLEHGLPLSEWMPDLRVEYHYPLLEHASEEDKLRAWKAFDREMAKHPMKEGPVVAISCASYRGSEAWKTWGMTEWCEMLRKVMDLGWRPILVGGNWDDLTYAVASELEIPDLVGKTSVSQMVVLMDIVQSYVGFSSGMNVIRTVLNKPAFALWPDFQAELQKSWAPPRMIEENRYVSHLWRPVSAVWPVAKRFLKQCQEEADSLVNTYPKGYNGSGVEDAVR